uniref:Fibrinogen- and Ig-binding protein-like n=1 Tax=Nicotiana tabacum TaxID=4097 RepID=A0A1S3XVC8_TOBAC|nr:PREDICTED: fibrinogen- and Ig-binding protein-like [Nicotiana tabacum]
MDGEKSLRLLYDEREDELAHLRYEASRSMNYESYLEEQLQKKTEDLECLWVEVGQAKRECNELEAQMDAHIAVEKNALAKTSKIANLESDLLKLKAEVVNAQAKAEEIRAKSEKIVVVYLKGPVDARVKLSDDFDRESKSNEYARCKSWRETLEDIYARDFDLSEEIAQSRADEYDAKFLLSNAEDNEEKADGPQSPRGT